MGGSYPPLRPSWAGVTACSSEATQAAARITAGSASMSPPAIHTNIISGVYRFAYTPDREVLDRSFH